MSLVLRPYQERAVAELVASITEAPVLVAPTGSGKTLMSTTALRRINLKALWAVHRRELVMQAAERLRADGCEVGVVMAGEPKRPLAQFQVGSIQTIASRGVPPGCQILAVDEAHHATSPSYSALMSAFDLRFGMTATPFRMDEIGLGSAGFRKIIVAAYPDDLFADGTLHKPVIYTRPTADLRGVRKSKGDYEQSELARRMSEAKIVADVVETWRRIAPRRPTVVFAVGVEHAKILAARFIEAGVATEVVTGSTPREERDAVTRRVHDGKTTVVVNCQVLTEGVDIPPLEVASVVRPTQSLALWLQMLGRITRACEGKEGAIVLDHAGNYHRHGPPEQRLAYSLEGKVAKVGKPMTKACKACGVVIPFSAQSCPACGAACIGVGLDRDMTPKEADGELVLVSGKQRAGGGYEERARDFRKMWNKATNVIVFGRKREPRGAVEVDASFDGLFGGAERLPPDPAEEERAIDGMAARLYYEKYGERPVRLGSTLLDPAAAPGEPGHINPGYWERLRAIWRAALARKGYSPERVATEVAAREEQTRAAAGARRVAKSASTG